MRCNGSKVFSEKARPQSRAGRGALDHPRCSIRALNGDVAAAASATCCRPLLFMGAFFVKKTTGFFDFSPKSRGTLRSYYFLFSVKREDFRRTWATRRRAAFIGVTASLLLCLLCCLLLLLLLLLVVVGKRNRIIRRNYTEVFGLPFYFIFVGEIKGFSEKNVREVFGQIKICGYMRIYSLRLKFFVGTIARHTHSYTIHLIRYISQVNSEYLACGGYTRSG